MWIILLLGIAIGWLSTTGIKSQWVRLLDIFVWGPLVIWAGYAIDTSIWIKYALVFMGASTITYNLKNFLISN